MAGAWHHGGSLGGRAAAAGALGIALMLLMLGLSPQGAAAGPHDAIVGSARVSDVAASGWDPTAVQENPDVAIDAFGRVHAVWQDSREGDYGIMYARSDDGGRSFGPSIFVGMPRGTGSALNPSVAVDSRGNPHVVWEDPRNSLNRGLDIYYARSYDGGDTFGPNVRVNSDVDPIPQASPAITVGPKGTIIVVYVSGSGVGSDVYMSVSADGGRGFSPMVKMNDDAGTNSQSMPSVAVDADGTAAVTWTDFRNGASDPDIFFAIRSPAGAISPNVRVNDDIIGNQQTNPVIALDDDVPVVVWTDTRGGNPDIYIARREGTGVFGQNRRVNADTNSLNQAMPDLSASGYGRLHVVWEGAQGGRSDIFLSNSTDGGASFSPDVRVNLDIVPSAAQHRPAISSAGVDPLMAIAWDDLGDASRGGDVLISVRDKTAARAQIIVSDDRTTAFEHSPSVAVDNDGDIHVVWGGNRGKQYGIQYATSSDGGTTWEARATVGDASGSKVLLTPDIVVGPDGTAHVAYTELSSAGARVMYANDKSVPSGFNPAVRVDDSPAGGFAVSPSVAVSPNGSVMVAWLDGRDGHVQARVAESRDTGASWQPSVEVPGADATSVRGPPVIVAREGLVAVAFTDAYALQPTAPFIASGPSIQSLGAPVLMVDATGTDPMGLALALDPAPGGMASLAWTSSTPEGSRVHVAPYDPGARKFVAGTGPSVPLSRSFAPSLAMGDGGTTFMARSDVSGTDPAVTLLVNVSSMPDGIEKALPGDANAPAGHPDVAFAAHQLGVVYVRDAAAAPRVECALYENSPPSAPVLQSPSDGGWVTRASFNLSIDTPTDADGDPLLVSFWLQRPDGSVFLSPSVADTRYEVVGAQSGLYNWTATVTDGYGSFTAVRCNFFVDLNPPIPPEFVPEPEYTPGTSNTLRWNATTDPEVAILFYKVLASLSPSFNPPVLAESDWVTGLNTTFVGLPSTTIYYRLLCKDLAGNTVAGGNITHSTQDTGLPKLILFIDPPLSANQSESITFNASGSTDDHGIASYSWDFGDGTVDGTTGATVAHAYAEAGTFNITVTLVDVAGNLVKFTGFEMEVHDVIPPTISLSVYPGTSFDERTTAVFNASGTTDSSGIKMLRWFLGNAQTPFAVGKIAQWRFNAPGNFTLRLEASDIFGNVATSTLVLRVKDITKPAVEFNEIGPLDNTKLELFTLYVNVTDNDRVVSVALFYKTQDSPMFISTEMERVNGSSTEWFKDELGVGGSGNSTYYIKAVDASGNENKTDYQKIVVTGTVTPHVKPPGDGKGFDILDWWWLILLLVVVAVGAGAGVAMMGRRGDREEGGVPEAVPVTAPVTPGGTTGPARGAKAATPAAAVGGIVGAEAIAMPVGKEGPACAIEEVYFIHSDGRLIHSATSTSRVRKADQDVFAGMFTAIQDFIKDSMARDGALGSFDYGDNRIIIERGRYVTIAVTIFGTEPADLRDEVKEVVRQVEGSYAGVVERWDGDKGKLRGIQEYGLRILGLTGGIDRETVLKARERKGVKLVSEVEFFQGFVRLKVAVKNDTETVITDSAIDIVYDDNVLRLDHIQPVYEYKRGKVHLGNVNAGEKKTVAFNFDPIICMESMIDGNLTYRDVAGKLQVVSMKSRRADIVCPIFFTKENANTAMLKRLIREELSAQDSKVYRYPDGLAPVQAFELGKGVVHLHDVKFVREFIEPKPRWLGEAWFYGETKVKGYKIVIRVTVREDSHSAEFFVASSQMEVITGLLAELGHSLNRMLKEKYMGRLKAQPIVDSKLKKEISEQPLLLERAEQ